MKNDIKKAVEILKKGGLIAIPTETVYGLAADAKNPAAIQKIFTAKGRPVDHPLIVHIGDVSQLDDWAIHISEKAKMLAKAFWPGPLTLILKKKPDVLDLITGGQDTIGVRIPNHAIALEFLKEFGNGVAAPSANKFGRISPTTAAAVKEELGNEVDLILDGGFCDVGVESTIVDVSTDVLRILRPGMISAKQIEEVLHVSLSSEKKDMPRVSGALESHYAPRTKTFLLSKEEIIDWHPENTAFIVHSSFDIAINNLIVMPDNPTEYAHFIYATLREVDNQGFDQIVIEKVPDSVDWDAIRDRVVRACC